jgi:hypothetical protein
MANAPMSESLTPIPLQHCPACAYDLTGLDSPRCPECGYDGCDVLYAAPFWLSMSSWMGPAAAWTVFVAGIVFIVVLGTGVGLLLRLHWGMQVTWPAAVVALLVLWTVRPFVVRVLPLRRGSTQPSGVIEFRHENLTLRIPTDADAPVIIPWSVVTDVRAKRIGRRLWRMKIASHPDWPALVRWLMKPFIVNIEVDADTAQRVSRMGMNLAQRARSAPAHNG